MPKHVRIFLLLFICQAMRAQTSGRLIEQSLDTRFPYTITQYASKHGLPQNQVLSITPRKNGGLVLSTSNGMVEFNGLWFKPVISDDKYKHHVYSKLMYHETTNQLFGEKLDGPLHLLFPQFKVLKDCRASCLQNDSIYCITGLGSLYAAHVLKQEFSKIAETGIRSPTCLILNGSSVLIGNGYTVYKYDLTTKTCRVLLNDGALEFKINPYNKSVYVIGPMRIYKLEGSFTKLLWQADNKRKNSICTDLAFISVDEFYLATNHGLFRITDNSITQLDVVLSQYIQSLYYNTVENNLFVGTGDKGLLKLQFKNCHYLSSKQGFTENPSLSSVIQTRNGDILTAVIDGSIYKIEPDTVYVYAPLKRELYSVLHEINDTIYAGTWGGGIKLIKNKQPAGVIKQPNLSSGFVHAILSDSKGYTWVGGDGVSRGTTLQNISPYLSERIKAGVVILYELKNGNMCLGGTTGFCIVGRDSVLVHVGRNDGLLGKEVRSFYEDKEGKLWIGTYGGGLYCYHKNHLTNINQLKNAKLDVDAFCLAKDSFGYLYITSNRGLWRVKETDLNDFYYGRLNHLVPFYYGEEAGIENTEFNSGFQNNYLKTHSGDFYFPSIQGLVCVKPEKPGFRKLKPVFERILINDTLFDFKTRSFDRKTYSIQFDFSSAGFSEKYNVYYQYKLESDGNGDWSPLQKSASVSFKMLPPNSYTFYLRALDASADKNPIELKFDFSIKPYFYETSWFKLLAVILFITLSMGIGWLIIRNWRKKVKEQERVKRELAELELKAVQAQMNPHFIFNSLNSIKHYLFINDTKSADIFIDNFSILLRDFLEYSNKDFITLEKEAEMLASYLALESMRMNPPFKYTINLPAELNKIKVPTLLFQAFAENAVKHGITHSAKECAIRVDLKLSGGIILCTISDDGIGRKRSAEINQSKKFHTSKGISIVEDKIKIIKVTHNIHVEFSIHDNVDAEGNALGTNVIIKIPVTVK